MKPPYCHLAAVAADASNLGLLQVVFKRLAAD